MPPPGHVPYAGQVPYTGQVPQTGAYGASGVANVPHTHPGGTLPPPPPAGARHSHPPPAMAPQGYGPPGQPPPGYGGPSYSMTPSHGGHAQAHGRPAVPAMQSQSLPAQGDRPSQPPATTGQYAVAIGVGVLVAALIAGGGFYAWHQRRAEGATSPSSSSSAPSSASVSSSGTASGMGARGNLVFETTPAAATLVVDGKELPSGTHQIPRPKAGTTVTLVVRAPGKKDATLRVDYFSSSPMKIALEDAAGQTPPANTIDVGDEPATAPSATTATVPSVKVDPPRVDPPRADPPRDPKPPTGQGGTTAPQGGVRPKPTPKDPALPANPY